MTAHASPAETPADPIASVLSGAVSSYALIRRPAAHDGQDVVDVLLGNHFELSFLSELAAIPFREDRSLSQHGVLALLPFRQIAERGYDYVDDGEKIQVLQVARSALISTQDVVNALPYRSNALVDGRFDLTDQQYAELARRIIRDEIGTGAGANFVLKRSFLARIKGFDNAAALSFFRQLVASEVGAYWTFIVRLDGRTFVGATPERHVSLSGGVATMNPISGTYRYPGSGPTLESLLSFLDDAKETNELYMVVDEELKMMARICNHGGSVHGPTLRAMAKLAHTEYHITGLCDLPPDEVLRETLFAPTITGSPLENACRVIKKYEPAGRGYYSGVIGLLGTDGSGKDVLDSSILIRTAEISKRGDLRIGVGATLVRNSDPDSEAAETEAKASGLLLALGNNPNIEAPVSIVPSSSIGNRFSDFEKDARVRGALTARNDNISAFWMKDSRSRFQPSTDLVGLRAVIIDAEDNFTWMIQHQMRSFGLSVDLRRHDESIDLNRFDIVVMGPGPGDPRDLTDQRIAALSETIDVLLSKQRPFLAVCLSHQILCRKLGLEIVRRPVPNQGARRRIDLFGTTQWVGFYNSFNALYGEDRIDCPGRATVDVSRDALTNEVFALRSGTFSSFQFHPESVLSKDGDLILQSHLRDLVLPRAARAMEQRVPFYLTSGRSMQI